MRVISRIAGLLVLLALLMLLIRGDLLSRSPLVILGQVVGVLLPVWARTSFHAGQFRVVATPSGGPLLTHGPYRYIRHPMYAGALLLLWSTVLGHWSLVNAALAVTATAATAVRIRDEERALREHFPRYADYCQRTKRLVPYVF